MSPATTRSPLCRWLPVLLVGLIACGVELLSEAASAQDRNWAALRLEDVDEDFAYQGEYAGQRQVEGGPAEDWGLQVVAQGNGEFKALAYPGGLPGAGWLGQPPRALSGKRESELLRLESQQQEAEATNPALPECTEYFELDGQTAYLYDCTGTQLATLEKVHRESPTLGAAPPEEAVVLIGEGVELEAVWENARISEEGHLREGAVSREAFGNFQLHLEYRVAYMPQRRGQDRGNSGVYLQHRYEVQVLDSFGRVPGKWDAAAVYGYAAPRLNMCLPPLAWQTFDIEFTAARFNAEGEKVSRAVVTVRHNGELVHEAFELPDKTGYGHNEGPAPGVLLLQNHGCPVEYRNLWIVPRDEAEPNHGTDPLEELLPPAEPSEE